MRAALPEPICFTCEHQIVQGSAGFKWQIVPEFALLSELCFAWAHFEFVVYDFYHEDPLGDTWAPVSLVALHHLLRLVLGSLSSGEGHLEGSLPQKDLRQPWDVWLV